MAQNSGWITIGGTYTASSTARCVSFSLWINQDDDADNIETYDTTTVIGEKGVVKVGGAAVNKIEHWKFSDSTPDDALVENVNYEISSVYGFGHAAYYNNLLGTLEGHTTPICCGREGLKSLQLIIAAYRSQKSQSIVTLPLSS